MIKLSFYQTSEQKKYIEELGIAIRSFAAREAELDETGNFPFENIKELKSFGYTKLTLPKQYGGSGSSLYQFLLGQERIAMESGATALSIGWHLGSILEINSKQSWNKEVLEEFYQEVANGALTNRAATEPKTGSPTRGGRPETIAVKEEEGWRINGRKSFTTLSPILDLFLVSAWVPETENVGWFMIHRDTAGIRIEETWNMIAMQGTGSHDLVLEDVLIDDKYYIEKMRAPAKTGAPWLLHIPACYIGIAASARNEAITFAKEYSPNSLPGPIADLPNVQRTIGEIELELSQARHYLYSVAEKWENKPEEREEIAKEFGAVKMAVTNAALSIVDKAMRVVGAKSLQRSNPLQRHYRNVRAGLHNPPMDDATISLLAKRALFE